MTQTTWTPDTAAAALADETATMQQIAEATGWPIIHDSYEGDCLVPKPGMWRAADESGVDIEVECDTAEAAAQEYVDGGSWDRDTTLYITVSAWRDGIDSDGQAVKVGTESHTISLDPEEPACEDGKEHDWQSPHSIVGGIKENPGVYGHGGGVTIQEVCMRCGCGKLTDTWAQDDCGRQGLTSVSYEPGKYADRV